MEVQDQERDGDGEHAIAEGLDTARLAHQAIIGPTGIRCVSSLRLGETAH
jgi:hypothetical protein